MTGEGKPMEQYEEISLKELLLIILKGWKWVVSSTLLVLGIAIIVFMVGNKTSYSLTSTAKLHYNQEYVTEYGTFKSELSKAEDVLLLIDDQFYKNLQDVTTHSFSVEDLKPFVSFVVSAPNTFTINYSGLEKVDLENLQSNVSNTLSKYLSEALQTKAKEQFIGFVANEMMNTSFESKSNTEIITILETELIKVPYTLSNNLINPAYNSLASKIQELKNENLVLNYTYTQKQTQLDNLNTLDFEETLPNIGIYSDIENNTNVVETKQFSAKTLFPISLVLGVMVSFFIVLFMNYWKTAK